jgi:MFS transporter, CP family, cyanate transporter
LTRQISWLWLLAIALVAANLRPVITSVPPIVDALSASLGLSTVAAGALTTLPVVCMGLFAPVAVAVGARYGMPWIVGLAVALIAVGAFVRSVALYPGTAVAGIGIAVAGALLPPLVRLSVPERVGPVTGLYTASLIAGALFAAGLTEPLRSALGLSPQGVLAVWTVPAVLALVVWLAWGQSARPYASRPRGLVEMRAPWRLYTRLPWRSRAAWLGTLYIGFQSLAFYGALAWLGSRYTSLGFSSARAGALLALFSATQVVTALAMPILAHRFGALRPFVAACAVTTSTGLLLIAVVPASFAAAPWLWAALLGLGMGGNLSLALTVLAQSAPSPHDAAGYTGMAFFVGYLLAAVGPVAAGALLDASGFTTVFLVLTILGLLTLMVGLAAVPRPTAPPSAGFQDPVDHEVGRP